MASNNYVKEARESLLMSKAELAREARVSPITIARIEKGMPCRMETKRGRELKRFGITEIPHGAIEDGTINDPESLAESIRHLLKADNIKERNVAISIGG